MRKGNLQWDKMLMVNNKVILINSLYLFMSIFNSNLKVRKLIVKASINAFFFKLTKLDIDYQGMYAIFVESLKKSYEQLYNHYNYIHSKCILEKQKKTFKKYLVLFLFAMK